MDKTLAYWLDEISVTEKSQCDLEATNWWPDSMPWAVMNADYVAGLFSSEREALQYRLFIINEELNGRR